MKTDCSLFYDMKDKDILTLNFTKEKIIQASVSLEHYNEIKDYKESDKLRKLLSDFNIQANKGSDGQISYFSSEPIWAGIVSIMNMGKCV